MKRLLALTAAACLIAAPLSFAQTNPQTPPTQTQPATPPTTTPAPLPAPTPSPTPPPAVPEQPAATTAAAPTGTPQCRTRKDAGEQCSCLSAPTNFGTSAPADSGSHNMCVIPSSSSSGE